jgi:hypothetical protein
MLELTARSANVRKQYAYGGTEAVQRQYKVLLDHMHHSAMNCAVQLPARLF